MSRRGLSFIGGIIQLGVILALAMLAIFLVSAVKTCSAFVRRS